MMGERSDQEWVRLLKQEDREVTRALWEVLFKYGVNSARVRCRGDEMRAQDVGHEAAIQAFKRITTRGVFQFAFKGPFQGYCRRIIVNEVYRVLSRPSKPEEELPPEDQLPPEKSRDANWQELLALLEPCLDDLGYREKQTIELLFLKELTNQEAAEALGIKRNNLYQIKRRALLRLKKCMEGRGFNNLSDLL